MGLLPQFHVDQDLCTECGDCIKALPKIFRKVDGEEVAEVFATELDESVRTEVERMMTECPGHAILWTK